jgi:N-glycosylase/DNA lyase
VINRIFAERLEYAVGEVCKEIKRRKNIVNWNNMPEEQLWNELVSCILGSQVRHEHLQCIIKHLISENLLSIKYLINNGEHFERNIQTALEKPIPSLSTKTGSIKYRYPRTKANYIRRTGESIYLTSSSIRRIITPCVDERIARTRIMSVAVGIGPKQASLFLRNIGYANNLAILDTHILKYMTVIGLVPKILKTVSYLPKYEDIEGILNNYATKFKESLACLDTAIWIVMRSCWKETIV